MVIIPDITMDGLVSNKLVRVRLFQLRARVFCAVILAAMVITMVYNPQQLRRIFINSSSSAMPMDRPTIMKIGVTTCLDNYCVYIREWSWLSG